VIPTETVIVQPRPAIRPRWGVFTPVADDECGIRVVRRLKDGKRWVRVEGPRDLTFTRDTGDAHVARVGLVSDGASIPRVAQSLIGHPFDEYLEAALIHDQLCRDRTLPARVAHRIFYEAMRAQDVAAWKARLMHAAVFARRPHWTVTDAPTADRSPAP